MPDRSFPLSLFHHTAETVEAYRAFLDAHGVSAKEIASIEDFAARVPVMDKENYLRKYPFRDLVPGGKIPPVVSASSGSSGKPFYWPRGDAQERAGASLHKRILCDIFSIGGARTLVIVCFSMGNWIAGTFTAASCRLLAAEEGLDLSVATPGIEKEDILAMLRDFAPNFETVILAGYPPFLMDIIREANARSIPLRFRLKFLLAGENFSENWRALICECAGIDNIPENIVSVYGTADAGALGHENPLTIAVRKRAVADSAFRSAFFGDIGFVPSLVGYDPSTIHFESIDGQLAFTANGGIPLIRYNIKDEGRVYSFEETLELLKRLCPDDFFGDSMKAWHFPLVALFGRRDVAVTFYALNIYPENIKAGIEGAECSKHLSGKFIASVERSDDETEQTLTITLELAAGVQATEALAATIRESIFESLRTLNSEYRKLHAALGVRAIPVIVCAPHGDERFKIRKSKHSWVEKH